MPIPTEPIGSIPRPQALIDGTQAFKDGRISQKELDSLYAAAIRDTIERFEATGSPVITDGEQTKPSFATYPISGLETLASAWRGRRWRPKLSGSDRPEVLPSRRRLIRAGGVHLGEVDLVYSTPE